MWYGDKQKAKVNISYALKEKGWKIFGFGEDQSDSMTDYYHPASWDGIAEKNGFILLIDISDYDLKRYSGYESKQYNYNKSSVVANERIVKLTALLNDAASTENEKASCAVLIEKELEKANVKPSYTVKEVYPIFHHANPKGTSWHIEKDGQILAKGKGVFSVNDYDWEDKTKTKEQQKAEKLNAFINRVESVLRDTDALETEVVRVSKTVIKPVETDTKEITKEQVNDDTYFVMKVNYTNGNYKGTMYKCNRASTIENSDSFIFARLGKNLKPSKASGKTWYLSVSRINEMLSKGHIAIVEMKEFTEYEEKTIFKKTARKQKPNFDIPALDGDAQEVEAEDVETVKNDNQATFTVNEKLNGIEISFPVKPSSATIEKLKSNGFRWHQVKKLWYAVKTSERLEVAESICNGQSTAQEQATEDVQYTVEGLQEISANVLINNGFRIGETPLNHEQFELYKEQVKAEIEKCKYKVTKSVIEKLKNEPAYEILVNALESFNVTKSNKQAAEPNQTEFLPKIDKQIESNKSKLDSLSGDYLTNTWKRQQEENGREMKRDLLRSDIALLEYLKDKAVNNNMTPLEQSLVTGSIREDLKNYRNQKYKYKHEITFPQIEKHLPSDGWWNLEVPKKQKRLQKANINNTQQLLSATDEYNSIISDIEKPKSPTELKIKKLESEVKFRRIDGYFPTPKTIVQRMIDLADINDSDTVLEPSAGNGNILDGIRKYISDNGLQAELEGIECNYTLREILELKGYKVVSHDFMEYAKYNHYDKIVMNPPFEKNQDIQHVQHAYKCLKDGGRIVAIMSPHFTFANDSKSIEFREWLDGRGYYEQLPEGSFKESGTGVNTVIVVIDKLEETAAEAI